MPNITARDVASYTIQAMRKRGENVTNLKLQKLLYYAQAWHLVFHKGVPLFPERIEAWLHGPVVPPLFGEYKHNMWQPIQDEVTAVELPEEIRDHIDEVLEAYGDLTASELSRLTHTEEPWLKARHGIPSDEPSTVVIPWETMESFYEQKLGDD